MSSIATHDDPRAGFEEFTREVGSPVWAYLCRRVDPATADDVLAEALLVCWRRWDDVPRDAAVAWTIGVARRCLANHRRSTRRQERLAARVATVDPPSEVDDAHPGLGSTEVEVVTEAMGRLRPAEAEVLRLWAWEQLEPREIAAVLGVTPNAVSIRLHRAKKQLRHELAKDPRATSDMTR